MNITVRQPSNEYTIRHMMRNKAVSGECQLSWDFNSASHFLMVIHPVRLECNLSQDIVPWLEKKGKELLEVHRKVEDGIIWSLIQEREFRISNNKYTVQRSVLMAGTPYRIVIYPCQIDGEDWNIYTVSGDANVRKIPVSIEVEIRYKKLFLWPKQMCMFRVRHDVNRLDGVLRYKPSGSCCQFPVSVESMKTARDGWVYVFLPRDEELNITAAPEYKEYYNIIVTDD